MTGLYRVERDEMKRKIYVCSKHPKKEAVMKQKSIVDKDAEFYEFIWKKRPHYCMECGAELHKLDHWFFHHVLPKKKGIGGFSYFRHDERNIILLCRRHHGEIESAISAPKMKIFPAVEKIKFNLLQDVGIDYEIKKL